MGGGMEERTDWVIRHSTKEEGKLLCRLVGHRWEFETSHRREVSISYFVCGRCNIVAEPCDDVCLSCGSYLREDQLRCPSCGRED